jgi:hypothetical protein
VSPRARRWLLVLVAIAAAHALAGRLLGGVDFMGALAEARRGPGGLALAFLVFVALRLIAIVVIPPVCLAWSALIGWDALRTAVRQPTAGA